MTKEKLLNQALACGFDQACVIDTCLLYTSGAVETAVARHAGSLEQVYTPCGLTYLQSGKDLRRVKYVVVTGGALIHAKHTEEIAKYALYKESTPGSLRPENAEILIDRKYILAAMGLLSQHYPEAALETVSYTHLI